MDVNTHNIHKVITLLPLPPPYNIQLLFLFPDMSERLFLLEKVSHYSFQMLSPVAYPHAPMVEKVPSRVANTRESALLAALYM